MDEPTLKQQRVLKMLAADLDTDEIAEILGITRRAVQSAIIRACQRLGTKTRSGAVSNMVRREMYANKKQVS